MDVTIAFEQAPAFENLASYPGTGLSFGPRRRPNLFVTLSMISTHVELKPLMTLSPEKLKLYERLNQAERQAVRTHQAFLPPELEDQEERVAYRQWRRVNHYLPKVERGREYARQRAAARDGGQTSTG